MNDRESYYNYLGNQFMTACPFPVLDDKCGEIRMMIRTEKGETSWIIITPKQLKRIEDMMFEDFENSVE